MKTPLAALSQEVRRLTGTCSRCGECLAVCPTFLVSGDESLSTRGRVQLIRAALEGRPAVPRRLADNLASCLGCLACNTVCPAQADPAAIIAAARVAASGRSPAHRLKARAAVRTLGVCAGMPPLPRATAARIAARMKWAPAPDQSRATSAALTGGLLRSRRAVPVGPAAVSDCVRPGTSRPRALLYPGCATALFFPETVTAAITVLNYRGYDVDMAPRHECCGYPQRSLGDTARAAGQYFRMLESLREISADAVVTLCPSCALALKRVPDGLPEESRTQAEELASRSFEIHQLLGEIAPHSSAGRTPELPRAASSTGEAVFWHDPCHLRYGLGIYDEPRRLLRQAGFVLSAEPESCCGAAGLFGLTHPQLSAAIGRGREREIAAARLIATGCPSCRIRLGRLSQNPGGVPAKVVHTVDLLAAQHKGE